MVGPFDDNPAPDPLALSARFPQFPVLVAPQSTGGGLSSARVAPLPLTFAPVYAWMQQLFHLQGGSDGRGGLRNMNALAHRYTEEAQRYVAVARALQGVARILEEAPDSRLPDQGYDAVVGAAAELTGALGRRLPAIARVRVSHPAFYQQWQSDGSALRAHITDAESWAHIQAFVGDDSVPAAQRLEIWEYIRQAVGSASDDIGESPLQFLIAEDIRGALSAPQPGQLWSEFVGSTSVLGNLVGRMAGPDTLAIVFIKAVATVDVVLSARLPAAQVGAVWHRLVGYLSRITGPTPLSEEEFTAAIAAWRNAIRNPSVATLRAAEARVDAYCENLKDRFNMGAGLSALSTVMSCIQLIAAFGAVADDEPAWRVATDITPGLLGTSTGVVLTINRLMNGVNGAAETRLALNFPEVATWARTWAEVIETGAGASAISCAFGVTAIVGGAFTLSTAREQHDHWMIAVGSIQIASGLLIVIGIMGVPGLQPAGAVLGFVAGALVLYDTARRQMSERVCRSLAQTLHDAQAGWDQSHLMHNIGVASEVDALLAAIGNARFSPVIPSSGAMRTEYIARLAYLGVPDEDANTMVEVTPEIMQERRDSR